MNTKQNSQGTPEMNPKRFGADPSHNHHENQHISHGQPLGGAVSYGSSAHNYSFGDDHSGIPRKTSPSKVFIPNTQNIRYQRSPPPNTLVMLDNIRAQTDKTKKFLMMSTLKFNKSYKYPSNLKSAADHQSANKLGKNAIQLLLEKGKDDKSKLKVCPCCDNMVIAEQFSLCNDTYYKSPKEGQERNQLPLGIVMYFTFIKMVIAFLVLRFLIFDIYSLFVSFYGSYCSNYQLSHTSQLCVTIMSAYNLKSAADQLHLNILDILTLVFTIISIGLFISFRKIVNYQQNLFMPFPFFYDSQFSILIENIPPFLFRPDTDHTHVDYQYENQLQKILEKKIGKWLRKINQNRNSQDLTYLDKQCLQNVIKANKMTIDELENTSVAMVTVCYDLTELQNIIKMRQQLLEQYRKTDPTKMTEEETKLLSYIPNQVRHLNEEYIRLCEHFVQNNNQVEGFKLAHFTGKAFISFEYEHYRDYFISKYEADPSFLTISGKPIKISYANKPNDVKWYNMKVKDSQRNKNIFYTTAVLIMLLILSFASLFFIQMWQNAQQISITTGKIGFVVGYLIVASQALLVYIINTILAYFLDYLSVYEKHKTQSDRQLSLNIKTIITQTINTVGTYAILYLIDPINPLSQFGLVSKIYNLVVVAGAINLFYYIVLPTQLFKWILNRCKYQPDKPVHMFQIELNRKIQYPPYNFTDAYAYYIIYSFVVSFYGFMVPLATPVLIFFFFVQYWVDKYNIFKRFSSPMDFSNLYTELMISLFEVSIVLFTVGHFLWDLPVHFDASIGFKIMNIISMVLAITYVSIFMFSTESFRKKILKNNRKTGILSYSDYAQFKVNDFRKRFKTQNPATSFFRQIQTLQSYTYEQQYRNSQQIKPFSQNIAHVSSYQPAYMRNKIKEKRMATVREEMREQTSVELLREKLQRSQNEFIQLRNQYERLKQVKEQILFEQQFYIDLVKQINYKIDGLKHDQDKNQQKTLYKKEEILKKHYEQIYYRQGQTEERLRYVTQQMQMKEQSMRMLHQKYQQQVKNTPVQRQVAKRSYGMSIQERPEKKSKKDQLMEAWLENEANIMQRHVVNAVDFIGEDEQQQKANDHEIFARKAPQAKYQAHMREQEVQVKPSLNQFDLMYKQTYVPIE